MAEDSYTIGNPSFTKHNPATLYAREERLPRKIHWAQDRGEERLTYERLDTRALISMGLLHLTARWRQVGKSLVSSQFIAFKQRYSSA